MKTAACFSTLLFLVGSLAPAYPNVGDKVKWEGMISLVDGTQTSVKIVKEVQKYNAETKKWTVKFETTFGKESTSIQTTEVDDLFNPDKYKDILSNCTSKGGTIEQFTAPAGTYETCKMTTVTEDGVVVEKWWGNIPFGIVSKATKDTRNTKPTKTADYKSVIADL
ncbi:MAG: hypothetical protein ACXVCP_13325 [Bdellovibrio sp.]